MSHSAINGDMKKYTVKGAKEKTLTENVVVVGKSMNKKAYYTAITYTTRNIFTAIDKII